MIRSRVFLLVLLCVVTATGAIDAQAPNQAVPPPLLTLDQAIQYATDHYPTVRAALEQVNASAAGVDVARPSHCPRHSEPTPRAAPALTAPE